MENVINLGVPHIGEYIFRCLGTPDLIQCLSVSTSWKHLAENVLVKRWKDHHIEATDRGYTEVVKLLLEHPETQSIDWNEKANVSFCNHPMKIQATAFWMACNHGRTEIVKLLLEYKEAKNISFNEEVFGENEFFRACKNDHEDVVKLLLEHPKCTGINTNGIDWTGTTPFCFAIAMGGDHPIPFMSPPWFLKDHPNYEIIKLLMDHSTSKDIDLNYWQYLKVYDEEYDELRSIKNHEGITLLQYLCRDKAYYNFIEYCLKNAIRGATFKMCHRDTAFKIPTKTQRRRFPRKIQELFQKIFGKKGTRRSRRLQDLANKRKKKTRHRFSYRYKKR